MRPSLRCATSCAMQRRARLRQRRARPPRAPRPRAPPPPPPPPSRLAKPLCACRRRRRAMLLPRHLRAHGCSRGHLHTTRRSHPARPLASFKRLARRAPRWALAAPRPTRRVPLRSSSRRRGRSSKRCNRLWRLRGCALCCARVVRRPSRGRGRCGTRPCSLMTAPRRCDVRRKRRHVV